MNNRCSDNFGLVVFFNVVLPETPSFYERPHNDFLRLIIDDKPLHSVLNCSSNAQKKIIVLSRHCIKHPSIRFIKLVMSTDIL